MRVVEFIKETRAELKHVSWPTRRQTLAYTALVIGLSILVALLLGFFDAVFIKILELVT